MIKLRNVSYVSDCYDERLTYVADNSSLKGEDLHLETKISEEDKEKLKQLFDTPKEITQKMVDIYNYMAEQNTQKIVMSFESGMKISFELDDSEWLKRKERKDG